MFAFVDALYALFLERKRPAFERPDASCCLAAAAAADVADHYVYLGTCIHLLLV